MNLQERWVINMGWASGSEIAEAIWTEVKKELNPQQQKRLSKFIYNIFCDHDADDWTWEEGSLEYDAYKMNNPKEWKKLNKEME